MTEFTHLSLHTEYSIEDSIIRINDLAERASELRLGSLAVTDRGNLFALIKFYKRCREYGIKPIAGIDVRVYDEKVGKIKPDRLILLVANSNGYDNLKCLISSMYRDKIKHRCLHLNTLKNRTDGLISLSGGCEGSIGRALLRGDWRTATDLAQEFSSWFDGRFYIDLTRTNRVNEDRYIAAALELAQACRLPVVATNDVCFLYESQFDAHEIRVCIYEKSQINDPGREKRYSASQYLRSKDEMEVLFKDIPEALENAAEIAHRCNLEIRTGKPFLPEYPREKGESLEETLTRIAWQGFDDLIKKSADVMLRCDEYRERLECELQIINGEGFAGYFLIVRDIVAWAKKNGIPVGPGRGSGPASLVSYVLDITAIDPVKYDLLFERLLNPQRVTMPDFDIDFCMNRRGEVIRYVTEKYGAESVGQIVTFNTLASKAVVRDVCRVQGKPYKFGDRIARLIQGNESLSKAIERDDELSSLFKDEDFAEILEMGKVLEGTVRNVGRHAAGIVIAPGELEDYAPYYTETPDGVAITQFDMVDIGSAGLVKIDLLGLKMTTTIARACEMVNKKRELLGELKIDIDHIPLDDRKTFDLLQTSETTGMFQLESLGMRDKIKQLQPDCIEDIVALVALYRPGPLESGTDRKYINRKHGLENIDYVHSSLGEVLEKTYGVMLYQEDVMNVSRNLCGFSLGEADLMRRAMGKKDSVEMNKQRSRFINGAKERGVAVDVANELFDDIEKFAGYAFNKAHASGYALVAYQTAWLKANYPKEFMASLLSSEIDTAGTNIKAISRYIAEIKRLGIELRPLNINFCDTHFVVRGDGIEFGLAAIKGVGKEQADCIVSARDSIPFRSLHDFCSRIDRKRINKRVVQFLVLSGVFDEFVSDCTPLWEARSQFVSEIEHAMVWADQNVDHDTKGIGNLFDGNDLHNISSSNSEIQMSRKEMMDKEVDALGFWLRGHPIDEYGDELQFRCISDIRSLTRGKELRSMAGEVSRARTITTRNNQQMLIASLSDNSGSIEFTVYGREYVDLKEKIHDGALMIISGIIQANQVNDGLVLRVRTALTINEFRKAEKACIKLQVVIQELNDQLISSLQELRKQFPRLGQPPLICVTSGSDQTHINLNAKWRIPVTDEVIEAFYSKFGVNAVSVYYPSA